MTNFINSLQAWNRDSPDFKDVLKQDLMRIDTNQLPLQQGLTVGSYVTDSKPQFMILGVNDDADLIHARAGIFYSSIIAGCSCADDPTPVDEQNEYCEVQIDINKMSGDGVISLIAD